MAGDVLALAIQTAGSGAVPAVTPIIAVAAGTGDRRCIIRPEQLGEFLRVHRTATIACRDAAALHWAIDEHLGRSGDPSARQILRAFSRACRLHDVRLLGQLLRLALHGGDPPPLDLGRLATCYGFRADTSEALRPSPSPRTGEPVRADEGPAVRALGGCRRRREICRKQRSQSDHLAQRLGIPREIVERFGPWALGLQVRGRSRWPARPATGCPAQGCRPRADAAPATRSIGSARASSTTPPIRRCFRWDGDVIRRRKTGLPDPDKPKLRERLRQTLDAMAGAHTPFEPPITDEGEFHDPRLLGRPDPPPVWSLRWSRLWAAASAGRP